MLRVSSRVRRPDYSRVALFLPSATIDARAYQLRNERRASWYYSHFGELEEIVEQGLRNRSELVVAVDAPGGC